MVRKWSIQSILFAVRSHVLALSRTETRARSWCGTGQYGVFLNIWVLLFILAWSYVSFISNHITYQFVFKIGFILEKRLDAMHFFDSGSNTLPPLVDSAVRWNRFHYFVVVGILMYIKFCWILRSKLNSSKLLGLCRGPKSTLWSSLKARDFRPKLSCALRLPRTSLAL